MTKSLTKSQVMAIAAEHDVAVYRGDTIKAIIARIDEVMRQRREAAEAAAEEAAAAARRSPQKRFARLATRHRYRTLSAWQIALPMFAPRNWSVVAGHFNV